MTQKLIAATLASLLWAASAGAVNTEHYDIPYFTGSAQYLLTDTKRAADDGYGYQFAIGVPLADPRNAVELRFADATYQRLSDGRDNWQTSLYADYVRDFGTLGNPDTFFGAIKPFAVAGVGLLQEDVKSDKTTHVGLSLGGGAIVPVGWHGLAVRLDARAQPQSNNESVKGEKSLVDYVVNLGVQIPMTWFYDRPMAVPAQAECPVAVVDAETGRRDCETDSDNDGVLDTVDQCPGTAAGLSVDANGCPRPAGDEDQDGVTDDRDECPGTPSGLKVNAKGCVVAQKSALRGVTFLPDSPKLTDEGRATLDTVAETMRTQADLKVEIAGHTDSVGSEAYNTMLSQQRADAVRSYLVGKGIEPQRMTAVGYGELEPVATNETEDGRKANRRVEFRISTE